MSDRDDDGILEKALKNLTITADWVPTEDYYVHIDVIEGSSSKFSKRINSFMISGDAFDPRRALNFPVELMDEADKNYERLKGWPVLCVRRAIAGIGDSYYELWKVRKHFSLAEFNNMVQQLPKGVRVRIVRVIDNDHEITVFSGEADE